MPLSVARYVRTITEEAAFGVVETSHYPALKDLLNAAGEEILPKARVVIHPQGARGDGIPDGAVWSAAMLPKAGQAGLDLYDTEAKIPDRGGVEVKGLAADLDATIASAQVARYLARLKQVIVTNYRQFAVVQLRDGAAVVVERYDLAPSPGAFFELAAGGTQSHERPLTEFLRRALSAVTAISLPGELAFFLASHAKEARDRLDAFENPLELQALKGALEGSLGILFEDERGDAFFRDELVQTLFYGLFSAWALWHEERPGRTDAFDWRTTASYLRVPVIDRLYNAAASRRILEQSGLRHQLENAGHVLNRVERGSFFAAFEAGLAVQYFYEPFLASFSPDLRRELGVWYTPPEIVRGMVAKCDRLLREELGEPDGLAGEGVLLLDPCCGTGAYLVEALRVIAERLAARGEPYADRLRRAATGRAFGFELLTGPFVVAHLQIAYLLARHGVALGEGERAAVFLTNALTGWEPVAAERRALDPLALYAESDRAHEIKRDERILVVLGNPPYSGYAAIARMEEEREIADRFRPERAKGQGINDLYVRFFAMADRRIEATGRGLVCFISNYSWLEGLSHYKMRESFLKSYDRIFIDNLHGDRKIGEYNPDGLTSETVFAMRGQSAGIRVGVAVTTLLRTGKGGTEAILYRDYHQARAEPRRLAFANDEGAYAPTVPPAALGFPFKPREVSQAYLDWPRLTEVFPTSFPGVQTSRDDLLVDIDRERLEARMGRYFDPKVSEGVIERETQGTMKPNPRYDAHAIRRRLAGRGLDQSGFRPYVYRPFDVRWLYWEAETKLVDEKRADYIPHVFEGNVALVGSADQRRGYSPPALIRSTGGRHLNERGANVFPLRLAQVRAAGSLLDDPVEEAGDGFNLSALGREAVAGAGMGDDPGGLFFHALAILHSPAYARENGDALRQDWPRVPLAPFDEGTNSCGGGGRPSTGESGSETGRRSGGGWRGFSTSRRRWRGSRSGIPIRGSRRSRGSSGRGTRRTGSGRRISRSGGAGGTGVRAG